MATVNEATAVLEDADRLIDGSDIEAALHRMAASVRLALGEQQPLVLVVMTGGLVTAGRLLPLLDFPLQVDYLHATRYRGETLGKEVMWLAKPRSALKGRHVLLVDDILDEGHTLAAIQEELLREDVASLSTAVLVEKLHERKAPGVAAQFVGVQVPDRYVFGYGMDFEEWHRNVDGIYAVAES